MSKADPDHRCVNELCDGGIATEAEDGMRIQRRECLGTGEWLGPATENMIFELMDRIDRLLDTAAAP